MYAKLCSYLEITKWQKMSWKIKAGKSIKCVLMKGYPNTTLGFPKQFCSNLKVTKNFTYLDL